MSLTNEQLILIEQKVTNESKSLFLAYALWYFLGVFGGHRFYLNGLQSGMLYILFWIVGLVTISIGSPFWVIPLLVIIVLVIVDAFLIPGMLRENREVLREKFKKELTN